MSKPNMPKKVTYKCHPNTKTKPKQGMSKGITAGPIQQYPARKDLHWTTQAPPASHD